MISSLKRIAILIGIGCTTIAPANARDFQWPAKDFTCRWDSAKHVSFEEAFRSPEQYYGLCVRFRAIAGKDWLLTKKVAKGLNREPMAAIWGSRTSVPAKPINIEAVGWLVSCSAAREEGQKALDSIDPGAVELMSGPCHYQDGPALFVSNYRKLRR